jgi:hypothetical protein
VVLAGFLHFENFAPLIGTAFGADVVRELALVTIGTFGKAAGGEEVVRTAF